MQIWFTHPCESADERPGGTSPSLMKVPLSNPHPPPPQTMQTWFTHLCELAGERPGGTSPSLTEALPPSGAPSSAAAPSVTLAWAPLGGRCPTLLFCETSGNFSPSGMHSMAAIRPWRSRSLSLAFISFLHRVASWGEDEGVSHQSGSFFYTAEPITYRIQPV